MFAHVRVRWLLAGLVQQQLEHLPGWGLAAAGAAAAAAKESSSK